MSQAYIYIYEMQSFNLFISFEITCYKVLVYNVIPCFGIPYKNLPINLNI